MSKFLNSTTPLVPPKRIIDPKMEAAQAELGRILAQFTGAPITEWLIERVQDTLKEFRVSKFLQEGVRLPEMKVIALPLAGFMQIWPAEMEENDLQVRLHNLIQLLKSEGRDFDQEELAKAVRRAYPDYSPSRTRLNKLN